MEKRTTIREAKSLIPFTVLDSKVLVKVTLKAPRLAIVGDKPSNSLNIVSKEVIAYGDNTFGIDLGDNIVTYRNAQSEPVDFSWNDKSFDKVSKNIKENKDIVSVTGEVTIIEYVVYNMFDIIGKVIKESTEC